tara:strand:+ start:334 stop:522 length:189 start_codon:yes stop_codon:yes gene_type:complete
MSMIQITKWLDPNDETWYKGKYITTYEWLMIEKERLFKLTNKQVVIETNSDGAKAIFREKIK